MKDLIERADAIEAIEFGITYAKMIDTDGWTKPLFENENRELRKAVKRVKEIPSIESNLILPERMKRGECYEVGETIVVMNHDDYYDLLCKAVENESKQGKWIDKGWHGDWQFETDGRGNCWKVFECSNCNCHARHITPFCPNCGAHMKGVDDETH